MAEVVIHPMKKLRAATACFASILSLRTLVVSPVAEQPTNVAPPNATTPASTPPLVPQVENWRGRIYCESVPDEDLESSESCVLSPGTILRPRGKASVARRLPHHVVSYGSLSRPSGKTAISPATRPLPPPRNISRDSSDVPVSVNRWPSFNESSPPPRRQKGPDSNGGGAQPKPLVPVRPRQLLLVPARRRQHLLNPRTARAREWNRRRPHQ